MLRSLLTPPNPNTRLRVGTEEGLCRELRPLRLFRNPWQEYGAVAGSSEADVATLKEHSLTASEIEVKDIIQHTTTYPLCPAHHLWIGMSVTRRGGRSAKDDGEPDQERPLTQLDYD